MRAGVADERAQRDLGADVLGVSSSSTKCPRYEVSSMAARENQTSAYAHRPGSSDAS